MLTVAATGCLAQRGDPPMDRAPKGTRIDSGVDVQYAPEDMWEAFFVARTPREAKVIASLGGPEHPPTADLPQTVHVTIAVGIGCAELQDAQLYADGDTLRPRLNLGEDYSECYQPYVYLISFTVPQDQLPQNPLFRNAAPQDPGVGVLVSADEITVGGVSAPWRVVEVTDPDQVAEWIEQNGGGPPERQFVSVDPVRPEDERRFAFLVASCQTPRSLRITLGSDGVPVLGTGDGTPYRPPSCPSPRHYLVVYDLPADAWSGTEL